MQIYTHFNQKLTEQKSVLQQSNTEYQKLRTELPSLVQKIQESDLTKGVN